MQAGEILRRIAFNTLDFVQGGTLNKIKKVNKREIVEGVKDSYVDRRLSSIMQYAKKQTNFYNKH